MAHNVNQILCMVDSFTSALVLHTVIGNCIDGLMLKQCCGGWRTDFLDLNPHCVEFDVCDICWRWFKCFWVSIDHWSLTTIVWFAACRQAVCNLLLIVRRMAQNALSVSCRLLLRIPPPFNPPFLASIRMFNILSKRAVRQKAVVSPF